MSDVVIKAENLGKKYIIGHNTHNGRYVALRDVLTQSARTLWNKTRDLARGKPVIQGDTLEDVWALKDATFEIHEGETVGIIGRNGAGKSTLLKVLSRITEPSAGRATIKGRVGCLLEVGTGFHPELTGRENIYLNGAILGMTRAEIKRKFDEIVAFAEVEQYLDTPVKRYSSGMYVRLAFAVAAHLEPEILIVDEVLAVGDTEFQKKCLGKMKDVAHEGRTVLFVSHNMSAIQRLCERGIVLNRGLTVFDGEANRAVGCYLGSKNGNQQISWEEADHAPGDDVVRLSAVRFIGKDGIERSQYDVRDPIVLEIEFDVLKEAPISVLVQFIGALGTYIMVSMDNYIRGSWGNQPPYSVGTYRTSCYIPADFLNEGHLSANLWISSPPLAPHQSPHVFLMDVVSVPIRDSCDPNGARGNYPYEWGIEPAVRPKLRWATEPLTKNDD